MNVLNKAVQTLSPLANLTAGDVFLDEEHGPMLKTDTEDEGTALCVCLLSGETLFVPLEDRVLERRDAELVLP